MTTAKGKDIRSRRTARRPLHRLQEVDLRPDAETVAASGEISTSPLREGGVVAVDPLEVRCTACGPAVGESCTTIVGDVRTPHVSRVQLAAHPDTCGGCGAGYGEPCRKVSGALSMYPHRALRLVQPGGTGVLCPRSSAGRP